MAIIKPFKAIRANEVYASRIAALPYDVMNREEAKREVLREPKSFLRIDRAETLFDDTVDTYDKCVYEKAHNELVRMMDAGDFISDLSENYYIYELTMSGRTQTGIVACASVDDYLDGTIMKHENTRYEKEIDRINHVDVCDAQTGPIFLTYKAEEVIDELVERIKCEQAPIYDFESNDQIKHRAWMIKEKDDINRIYQAFLMIDHIYIADGHHRCASAAKVALKRREENPLHNGKEEYNYFLSVLFPHNQLKILDYNRVIKDMEEYTASSLLTKLADVFYIEKKGKQTYRPVRKGNLGMYLEDNWYSLSLKEEFQSNDAVDGLDVSRLQDLVLEPFFHIADPKTDKRIDFVGGIRGLDELERRVHKDCKVAFAMYPTSIEELFAIANEHRLMPPKSTWFEPKLRSGLFIHKLS